MYMHISRYLILFLFICVAFTLISGCTAKTGETAPVQTGNSKTASATGSDTSNNWMTIPITDVVTGTETSIVDLASEGKPVIMHTFAVWCPACSMQLRETKKLNQDYPDRFIVIGVDIDPRENSAQVKNHIEKNEFVGMYVSVPPEFTRSLMNTVGDQIIRTLPQTVIICNKSVTYIGDGVFPEKKLDTILTQLC